MAKFVIYSFKLHLTSDGMMRSLFTEEEDLSPKEALERKQELFQKIIDKDISKEKPFKCKRNPAKGYNGPYEFGSQFLWTKDAISFLQIENEKDRLEHINFKKRKGTDYPWCNVIIDNRENVQHIAIQNNNAFPSTDFVATILRDSFNERLADYYLEIDIDAMYQSRAFWSVIDRFKEVGIRMIQFDFGFPNIPWASDSIEGLNVGAKALGARPSAKFTATDGGRLLIDSENKDENIEKLIHASGGLGSDIVVQPNGSNELIHCKEDKEQRVQKPIPDIILDGADEEKNFESTQLHVEKFVKDIQQYYD